MYRRFILVALLLPIGACASAQAKAPVDVVSLDVPPAPPRVIDPAPVEPPPIPPVEDLAAPEPTSPAPSRARQSRDSTRTEPRTEAKPETPEPEPVTQPPPAPVPPLRTGTLTGPEAERQILDTLARADRILETVDLRGVSDDRRAAYDNAKESVTRAREALKASNVVLARSLAERAENFAKLLSGR